MLSALDEKKGAALSSVVAAVFLTALKLLVGLKTNSLGIISEAAHSGLDLIAAFVTLYAVQISDKPPDSEHPYGHGKFENVSALIETVLLVITCGWILLEAAKRLIGHEHNVEVSVFSFGVMALAIIIDFSRSRVLARTAKKHHSQALEADALHFSSDIWTSLVVIFGLACVKMGFPVLDPIAAITVAMLVLFVSYRLGRRTIDVLVDRVPAGLYDRMYSTILAIEGVEKITNLRLRSGGARVFVDAAVTVRRTMPFDQASAIVHEIEERVRKTHHDVDIVVTARPVETSGESVADKVRMIVIQKGLHAPHSLEVHRTGDNYFISFDVEFPGSVNFEEAHRITVEIERDIRAQIPSIGGITIHIEENQPDEEQSVEITPREETLRDAIRSIVLSDPDVIDCPGIILLRSGEGYNVSLTCGIDRTLTIARMHEIVSRIESNLYRQLENIHRVTIHAEPRDTR